MNIEVLAQDVIAALREALSTAHHETALAKGAYEAARREIIRLEAELVEPNREPSQ